MGLTKEETGKTYSLRITENALRNFDEITGYIAFVNHQSLNAIRLGEISEAKCRLAGRLFSIMVRTRQNDKMKLGQ